jgi:hypothetical protein
VLVSVFWLQPYVAMSHIEKHAMVTPRVPRLMTGREKLCIGSPNFESDVAPTPAACQPQLAGLASVRQLRNNRGDITTKACS